ncbi:MAG: hypothetical protein GX785_19545 [Armatimonadetes bacterium]|nr:hypothetical protein [Armatimonadota bacterium]
MPLLATIARVGFAGLLALGMAVPGQIEAAEIRLDQDRIRLQVDEASGRITRVEASGANLTAPDAVSRSGFALADGPKAECVPVTCRVTPRGVGGLLWDGQAGALRIACQSLPVGRGIEFSGSVDDPRGTDGTDHAVTLRFALPVKLEGWRMDRDLDRSWPLRGDSHRSPASPCPWGRGRGELWPVVAVACEKASLGLGCRLDEPRCFRVTYDGPAQLLSIEIDFALARSAKQPGKAGFRFILLARPDSWGLRGCLSDYYATYPELFRKRTELAGGWFAWGDILSLAAPAVDFGLAFHEGPENVKARIHSLALGAATFPYIEPLMYQLPMGDFDRAPVRAEIEERIRLWSKPLDPLPKMHRGHYDQTRCAATLASGIRDPDGSLHIAAISQYPWIAGTRWAAQLALNVDPEIPGGAGELYLAEERENIKSETWGEGRYLDSFSSHANKIDYAPDHLAHADHPLIWKADEQAPGGFRVGQPVAAAAFEYAQGLRELLDTRGKLILVNQYGHGAPAPFHVFDCLGKEYWVPGAGRLLQRYRATSYQKVVSNLPRNEPISDRQLREFLVYGIFPGGYGRPGWGEEGMRATYRQVVPLLRLQHRLGWEPVPHAVAKESGVLIERFGGTGGKPLCLAVHSRWGAKVVTLTLDHAALGLPGALWCHELVSDDPVTWVTEAGQTEIQLGLASGETRLLAVGDARTHAAIARILAEDRLRDARLCTAEYRLREGRAHLLERHLQTASHENASALLSLAERVTGGHALDQRIAELLREAARWARAAEKPEPRRPRPVTVPPPDPRSAGIPWKEDFSQGLREERWSVPRNAKSRIEVKDGRLEMELSSEETSAAITTRRTFDFGEQPLEFRWRFQFNHAGHEWYLMQGVRLAPEASDDGYILFRIDPGIRVRLENADTPPSNFEFSLTPYESFATNVPHQVRLVLTPERFFLEMDGKRLGEGEHDCHFTQAAITLSVSTGHKGRGDVVWWDDIEVVPTRWPTEAP